MGNERPLTAKALNAMTGLEKIEFARSPFVKQWQVIAGTHVTTFRWSYVHATLGTQRLRNGSAFFIDISGRTIAVTAAHVYRLYLEGKQMARGKIACQLGDLTFNPEARLIAVSDSIDIATFNVSADELTQIGKRPFIVPAGDWPPPHPSQALPGHIGLAAYLRAFRKIAVSGSIAGRSVSGCTSLADRLAARRIARSPCPLRDSYGSISQGWDFHQKDSILGALVVVR